jgi:hypothetical protein
MPRPSIICGRAKEMGEISLKAVEEGVKYLMEIVETLLQLDNLENYRSFLTDTETMRRES